MPEVRIGSLFSGIGGLELGLEAAGIGKTVWQVERDPFCRAVLAKHWPCAVRHEDVKDVGKHNLEAAELICGGFPCQDVSSAGKRAGLAGARSGLWFEYLRVVRELRPHWVVVENVASGAAAWVDVVVAGLDELGYRSLPVPLAAADVGAPHERARVFIVAAHVDAHSQPALTKHAEVAGASAPASDAERERLRLKVRSEAKPPVDGPVHAANTKAQGLQSAGRSGRTEEAYARLAHDSWSGAEPDMVRVVHGVPRGLDSSAAARGYTREARRLRSADSSRVKALGNAVVPQCAEVIGHVIRQLMGAA